MNCYWFQLKTRRLGFVAANIVARTSEDAAKAVRRQFRLGSRVKIEIKALWHEVGSLNDNNTKEKE